MDTQGILKRYAPLLEKLTEKQKAFLDGMDAAIEDIDNYKFDFKDNNETSMIEKIQNEIAIEVLESFKERLLSWKDEWTISFIESNPYEIDENGNVVETK